MNQIKDCSGFIISIGTAADKAALIWEQMVFLLSHSCEEIIEAFVRVAELFPGYEVDESYPSSLDIEKLFDGVRDRTINLTGTPPKEYARSLHKHRVQSPIHYNYIPRTHRNLPYQRRTF